MNAKLTAKPGAFAIPTAVLPVLISRSEDRPKGVGLSIIPRIQSLSPQVASVDTCPLPSPFGFCLLVCALLDFLYRQ